MVILLKRKVAINFPTAKNSFQIREEIPFQKAVELIENFQFSLILLSQTIDQSESTATDGLVDSDASARLE